MMTHAPEIFCKALSVWRMGVKVTFNFTCSVLRSFALLVSLSLPMQVSAAWVWSTTTTNLSLKGNNGRVPRIAGNGSGSALSIWPEFNGTNWIIQASFYTNGQWQTTPTDISIKGQDTSLPQVAWYPNGSARAVWLQSGNQNIVKTSFYDSTQNPPTWGIPQNVSSLTRDANTPQIAIDANNNAQIVYTEFNGSHWILQLKTISGDQIPAAKDLSVNGVDAYLPQIAMAPDGSFNVAWTSGVTGANTVQTIQSRDGVLGRIVQLSLTSTDAKLPMLCVDVNGVTSAVWVEMTGSATSRIVTRQMIENVWGTRALLSPSNLAATIPTVVSTGSGNLAAGWIQQTGGSTTVFRTRIYQSGQWLPAKDLAATGNAQLGRIAGNANGEATAVWVTQSGTSTVTNGSYMSAGVWSTPQALGKGGQNAVYPDVAMPATQVAQVVWLGTDGTNDIVQALGGSYVPLVFTLTVNRTGKGKVSSAPAGIDCGATCTASFTEGTGIQLTAVPDADQNFLGWTGACKGTGECLVTISANTTVGARFFASADYALRVLKPTGGQVTSQPEGIDCGLKSTRCKYKFGKGANVILTATPKEGFDFVRWEGCAHPDQLTCTLTLEQPLLTLKAFFKAKPKFRLGVVKTRNGSVTSEPKGLQCGNNKLSCSGLFVSGSSVSLTATPVPGHQFTGWGGACSGVETTCQILMGGKLDVRATFE